MADNLPPLPLNFSQLARQIAMDLFPLDDILQLHQLTDAQWTAIQANPQFQSTLQDMITEWNTAGNTKTRVRIKAATGFEAVMEPILADCIDPAIPLNQRIEGLKLLARIGELVDAPEIGTGGGDRVMINIYTGQPESSLSVETVLPPIDRAAAVTVEPNENDT
jgi:hypothetical protein